uniref:Putative tauD/TfdA-like domain-containing protein n=1 Tax=Helianthus annuus TaxID=4232 RepID=A0A251UMN7_HELAN
MQMASGKFFRDERLPEQKFSVDGVYFPMVSSPSDFNDVVEAFGFPEALYVGGRAPRSKVVGRIYTANESPMDERIPFHHDMNYVRPFDHCYRIKVVAMKSWVFCSLISNQVILTKWVFKKIWYSYRCGGCRGLGGCRVMMVVEVPDFPSKLFFFCEEEPGEGGETPIVLSKVIYEKMKEKQPEFVGKLEKHGVKYTILAGDDDHPSAIVVRDWKSTYRPMI